MLHVDLFGAYVICGASAWISAGMVKLARPGESHMQQGLDTCAWAFVCLGLGLFQFVFAPTVPPPWSILCGVEGVAVGTAVFGWGFARFSGRRLRRSTCLLALALLALGLALLQQVATPHAFAALFDLICLAITGWIVVGQRHYLTAPKNRAEFVLGVAIWIYAISWVIRGAASLASDGPVKAHMLYVAEPFLTGYAIFYGTIPIIISALMLNMVNAHLNERLQVHASTDDLTGLRTRRALRSVERSALLRADPQASGVAALIIDVDHFKAVNDRHGHAIGDQVLVHIARAIQGAVRPGVLVMRYGGEEFVVLLPVADPRAAQRVAERLRGAVERRPFETGTAPRIALTVSVGLAFWLDGEALERALGRADDALYGAKAAGRNRVRVAPERVA